MSMVAYVASIASSVATCAALIFAGLEFRRSRRQDEHKQRVAIEGVAVSWRPPEVPKSPHNAAGQATWEYEFTAYNPGELPISDVKVEVHFAIPVMRIRYDGTLEAPTQTLVLEGAPVLAGHGTREWDRRLVMNYEKAHVALRQTKAEISFADPEDPSKRHTNRWPKQLWLSNKPSGIREVTAAPADAQAALGPGHPPDRRR
jgi:hypothetical protein